MTAEADEKLFLQALIQLAAACVHLTRGNAAPGVRLMALAEEKLLRLGGTFEEINSDLLRKEIGRALEQLGGGAAPADVARAFSL